MKQVTWNGGPGHVFNAENVSLAPGERRIVADELAERLLIADEHAANPGQLEVRAVPEPLLMPADDDEAGQRSGCAHPHAAKKD